VQLDRSGERTTRLRTRAGQKKLALDKDKRAFEKYKRAFNLNAHYKSALSMKGGLHVVQRTISWTGQDIPTLPAAYMTHAGLHCRWMAAETVSDIHAFTAKAHFESALFKNSARFQNSLSKRAFKRAPKARVLRDSDSSALHSQNYHSLTNLESHPVSAQSNTYAP